MGDCWVAASRNFKAIDATDYRGPQRGGIQAARPAVLIVSNSIGGDLAEFSLAGVIGHPLAPA